MPNNRICVVLILFQEIISTGKSYLIDIFINFLSSQTDTPVGDSNGIFTKRDMNGKIAQFPFKFADRSQCIQFLGSIDSVRNQFTKKNLMIAIQELFNDRENVLCCNPNITFLHNNVYFLIYRINILYNDVS